MKGFVLQIKNALFKFSLQKSAPTVFPKAVERFEIKPGEKWVVWGSERSKFMDVIGNKYLAEPPLSLKYGQVREGVPRVEFVKFTGVMPTAHLSARYEYFKDDFDQTCGKFIKDNSMGSMAVSYEVSKTNKAYDPELYASLIKDLKLEELEDRWAMGLSNGQMRRARLARSLLKEPDLVLLEDPFLGLDPTATSIISTFIGQYTRTPIVIGLRHQDEFPSWCTHVCYVDETGIVFQGDIHHLGDRIDAIKNHYNLAKNAQRPNSRYTIQDLISFHPLAAKSQHDMVKIPADIELNGLSVSYRGVPILKDLHWKVPPRSKWHIRGNNGTGKSTLLSLLTADHPQSWNSKIVEGGVPRRTGSTDYFTINKKIGMSSPELHAIFNKSQSRELSVREALATGFQENSSNNFLACYRNLDERQRLTLEAYVDYFGLQSLQDATYGDISVSDQKLVLFVRALLKMPQLLILDEAFSAMDEEPMHKCFEFLKQWPGIVLVVSHVPAETPDCNHFLQLVSPGEYEIGETKN
ncbi:LAFA_0C05820g1_1 [Lachancea sp. 'fantastica']|nr:LAFA_0C05820g1_1 [Lachancea sp. 'fantastica']